MRDGLRATGDGVRHFFSFGKTRKVINTAPAMWKNNGVIAKGQVVEAIARTLVLNGTPIGLVNNTISSVKTALRSHSHLKEAKLEEAVGKILDDRKLSTHTKNEVKKAIRNTSLDDDAPVHFNSPRDLQVASNWTWAQNEMGDLG